MAGRFQRTAVGTAAALIALACAGPASAARLLTTSVEAGGASDEVCSSGPLPAGDGVIREELTSPAAGWISARLEGQDGDWDVAIHNLDTGSLVAGSAGFGAQELAEGLVGEGTRVAVQACRLSGPSDAATLEVESSAVDESDVEKASMVQVITPNRTRKNELTRLGLDLTEHGGKNFVGVVLHGEDDARTLRENKFMYRVVIPDMDVQSAEDREKDARFARSVQRSSLPSGRDTYRRLNHYGEDLKKLVNENPTLVKPIVLPHKTWEGRTVEGVEISANVNDTTDGKPVFLQMGVHHAREWPSGEHAIEWAFELVNGYKAGNTRARGLMHTTRTIVIPLVNPDGFNISREAGAAQGADNGRGTPNPGQSNETVNIATHPYEYKRKNCRLTGNAASCFGPSIGFASTGVDPNRNYGTFWGGNGASGDPTNETYYGPGPFSEPETQNIKELVSQRHVTTLITNHTFSDLVLRPPGVAAQGEPADAGILKSLGDRMAAENGYLSLHGYQLYDTTGTTEDWSYNSTGGLGYTFEIGCTDLDRETNECHTGHFHPPFAEMVKEWEGTTTQADEQGHDGRGNREAYYIAQENTADASKHSVIEGRAPGGAVLRVSKAFQTPTSRDDNEDGQPDTFEDRLNVTTEVPGSGHFSWHINPSTRPLVARDQGRPAHGEPSEDQTFSGTPGPSARQCPTYFEAPETREETCWNDHPFEIPGGAGVDNGFVTVRAEWSTAGSDWDMEIYRDTNGDGSSADETGEPAGSSTQGTTDFEQTTLGPDPAPGKYVVRMINWAASEPYDGNIDFQGPLPFRPAQTESWRLTCESFSGTVLTSQDLVINRGEQKDPGLQSCVAAFSRAFASGRGCDRPTGRVYRKGLDRGRLGRDRLLHLRSYRIGLKGRRNLDKFCLSDRRAVRIGYPTDRILRQNLGRRARSSAFASNKAVMVITSSRRFRVRRVRVGMSPALMSRRIGRRIRPIRIGANRWYAKRGRAATLLFKVRSGRVREVGHASRVLTNNRRKTARLLRSFPLR